MGKTRSLLRAMMSGGMQLFKYQAKSRRSQRLMPLVLGVLIGSMMLLSASAMMTELNQDGKGTVILSLYTIITAVIIAMEGTYKASDLLFKPRDNDMLLAMPIRRSTIVLARMVKFYLFEMVYCLIFLLPAIIAYAASVEVGASFVLVAITMLVLVPAIPIAVGCLVGLVIAALSGRFRHKTFWQVAFSFVVMFATVGLVMVLNTGSPEDGGQMMIAVSEKATEFYYPAAFFARMAMHFDILEYLGFVGMNLVVLAFTVLLIGKFCFQIISRLSIVERVRNAEARYVFRRRGQMAAMIRKEVTRYFNTPVLLVNTAMGLVFFAVAVGALCFKFDDLAGSLVSSIENFPLTADEMRGFLPGATFAMVAFASLLTCITATMISLEGKAINVLKALPISGVKVIMGKVLAAVVLIIPVTLLGSLVMMLRFQFGVVDAVLVLIGAVAMPLVTELIGILINLKYAKFDADNDTVVVRQSASVMAATFLGLIMVLVTVSMTFATVFLAGQTAGLAIMDGLYLGVCGLLYMVVAGKGEEKYRGLSA